MPIPIALQNDQNNVSNELLQLSQLVKAIKVTGTAATPSTSLSNIATYLAAINTRLALCNTAGQVTSVDRHYMGTQFQGIANELNKP